MMIAKSKEYAAMPIAGASSGRLTCPLDLQLHPVIGWNHVWRQALPQHLVIEVGMHVGDHGALRLEALDPGQRIVDAEMAGMRRIAQSVDDPEIEILQRRPALFRNIADIRRIGGVANAVAERGDVAVLHDKRRQRQRPALALDGMAFTGLDRMLVEDRRILAARRRDEAV